MRVHLAMLLAVAACQADIAVGDSPGVLFGASVQPMMMETQADALTRGERTTGRHFDVHRIYHMWDDAVPGTLEQWTIANGRTPIVSFKLGDTLLWADLAAGAYDARLSAIAAGYAALGAPVFCIFDHSPENDPQGTPEEFAAAYRHIVETFRAAGVTNVMWVFNMKSVSFPDLADQYYPGDDVVDWNGVAAYNYGRWVSFADLVADFIAWGTRHGKPLIISEWASDEDGSQMDRKAIWIQQARVAIRAWPQVRVMSTQWVHNDYAFNMDSSTPALAAFQAFAADPYTHLRDSP